MIVYVGVFTSVDGLLCLLRTCVDPHKYIKTVSESKSSPVITVTGSCQSTWLVYWTSVQILYKCLMIMCTFFLALRTKLGQKEFKTNNVIILSYILAVAVGLGIPFYRDKSGLGVQRRVHWSRNEYDLVSKKFTRCYQYPLICMASVLQSFITEVHYYLWTVCLSICLPELAMEYDIVIIKVSVTTMHE